MTFVVTENCIKCKYMDCVEVCPVDCFYEGETMLVINPSECIDCGVCEPECPVEAIKPDTEDEPDGKWLQINAQYAKVWPNITVKGEPPADKEAFERETGKFENELIPGVVEAVQTLSEKEPRTASRRVSPCSDSWVGTRRRTSAACSSNRWPDR